MKLGICESIENAVLLKETGDSYIELNIGQIAQKPEKEYQELKKTVKESGLNCYAYNCLFPVGFHVIGKEIDKKANQEHLEKALFRAKDLGGEIIVFGSGHSRKIPEGFGRSQAEGQLIAFLELLAKLAEKNNIVIVLEPLPSKATNIVNTGGEGLKFVKQVNHPRIRLLIDYWHMNTEKENPDIVLEAGKDYLKHVHIANPNGGIYPLRTDEVDYAGFIERLKKIGYQGGISIEAGTKNIWKDAKNSFAFLSPLCKD